VTLNETFVCSTAGYQAAAYALNYRRHRHLASWWAHIDVDEFIVLRNASLTLDVALSGMDRRMGAVSLPWRIFGTAGHAARPPGSVITSYTRRARLRSPDWRTRSYKSVLRSSACDVPTVHSCNTFADGEPPAQWTFEGRTFSHGLSQIPRQVRCRQACAAWVNHYRSRSLQDWSVKRKRGRADKSNQVVETARQVDSTMRGRAGQRSETPQGGLEGSSLYGERPPEFYNAVRDVRLVANVVARISRVGDERERHRLTEILLRNSTHVHA